MRERSFFDTLLGFIRIVIASSIGVFIAFFGVVLVVVALIFATTENEMPSDTDTSEGKTILKLRIRGQIAEMASEDPLDELGLPALPNANLALGLRQLKEVIKEAAKDTSIDGIYIETGFLQAGFPILTELRNAIFEFRKSGKFVYVYGEFYDEKSYFLATAAEKIFLCPSGIIEFNGLSAEKTYYLHLFEKLGIKPKIFKVGTFKSAIEPFMLDKMSDADRQQTASYLNSVYATYMKQIAEARKIDFPMLDSIADNMLARNARTAFQYRLVDDTLYYDQVEKLLKEKTKTPEKQKPNFISYWQYKTQIDALKSVDSDNQIAVIVAEGDIVSGEGESDEIGSDRIAAAIRKARQDDKVKAIVLRINSPGGSALASDVMWREVIKAKEKKPIYASMSNLAASGGYYMAMACDKIIAHPHTITGSIGIFGLLFEADKLFSEKLGITFDRINTGNLSDVGMPTKVFSVAEEQFFEQTIKEGYHTFTSKAAQGRKMPLDSLQKYAEGRVWTGAQAQKLGLVDALGSLEDAIEMAAKAVNLKEGDYEVNYMPTKPSYWSELLAKSTETYTQKAIEKELGNSYVLLKNIKKLKNWQGTQARLPYELDIR